MMAGLFILYIAIRCRLNPSLGPVLPKEERDLPMAEKLRLLRAGCCRWHLRVMMVPFVNGWTSLVESSAIGAMTAFLAAVLKGRMTRRCSRPRCADARHHLHVHVDHPGGARLRRGVRRAGRGQGDREPVHRAKLGLSPWVILILMQLSFILMGTFLDDTAMLVIVAPLYVPLVGALGFDLIWYGVLYTITCQIAYMTPPFGYNLFLMRAMAPPEISLRDIYRSIIPFVA
jgi:TRAP-type mannitol/chloroaromatic compound transport system permease large subunit